VKTATLSALAEPNRLHIVELLIQRPLTVGEIATRLQMRQPQASKHLRVLSEAGVVEVEAVANRRICKLRAEPFQELDDWLGSYRQLWEDRFDRLDGYLRQLQQGGEAEKPRPDAQPGPNEESSLTPPQEALS
jgi:DNA-binding transcriptional ArsR family regulator